MKLDLQKKKMKTVQKMERWGKRGHECNGNKKREAMARDSQDWRKIVWEAKVQNGL